MTDQDSGNTVEETGKPNNTPNQDSVAVIDEKQEERRSNVRIRVTYGVALTYCAGALLLIIWLLLNNKHELAISTFAGIAGVASSIMGYWFGSRQSPKGPGK